MKATDFPRVKGPLSIFDSAALFAVLALFAIDVEPPPLNTANVFAVFDVRDEEIEGTTFLLWNLLTIPPKASSAKAGVAVAAKAAAAAAKTAVVGVVELPAPAEIAAIAVLVRVPASATIDPNNE
mmetsp:Transcript_8339/g.20594  ORF Transcript_8339/g.20594 Transcript_8339/m.20594 type:complete len:125 (-) Transcript_8339:137-511(-)